MFYYNFYIKSVKISHFLKYVAKIPQLENFIL